MQSDRTLSNDDEIRRYIGELDTIIYQASHCFDVWWTCTEPDSRVKRVKYVKIMNSYGMFFRTSIHAHFVAMLMALYKLYENNKETINFKQLIKLLKSNCTFSKTDVDEYEKSIQVVDNLWKKVWILRNKTFGHRNKLLNNSEIFAEANVTPDDLWDIIKESQRILAEIARKMDVHTYNFEIGAKRSTIKLLEDLKCFKKNHKPII